MTLWVILLCLFLERHVEHPWMPGVKQALATWLNFIASYKAKLSPAARILFLILPVWLILWITLAIFGHLFWGLLRLFIEVGVLFACLAETQIFVSDTAVSQAKVEAYFEEQTQSRMGVLIWYALAGVWGASLYRLLTLASVTAPFEAVAMETAVYLDWVVFRITACLYAFAGHFQRTYTFLLSHLWTGFKENQKLITGSGLRAAYTKTQAKLDPTKAQALCDRALVIFLVVLALMTLASW